MGYVLWLDQVDRTQAEIVGGKGALLGEVSHIEGVSVPAGFCVTTGAFARAVSEARRIDGVLEIVMPDDVAASITRALERLGTGAVYAVRSSATAEDSPTASFAGQHDTFLNVSGVAAVLREVSRCWASLFTERAVTYRARSGLDERDVGMGVVVQEMMTAEAAGVLFTADPVTSNRKVASVEAAAGLGEDLVAGRVNPDLYKVRDGQITEQVTAGTPLLTEEQIVGLVQLGRRIEAHLGHPQDIEWCLLDDGFQILQSRPITTLFPIPPAEDDGNHVYVSVGHQQMMTDAIKPLGISFWLLTALRPMVTAGGRLFVDVARDLASPSGRASHVAALRRSDPLIGDALQTVLDRDGFLPLRSEEEQSASGQPAAIPPAPPVPPALLEADPALVEELIAATDASNLIAKREIAAQSGVALLDFIAEDIEELKRSLSDPRSVRVLMAGIRAIWWLNEQLEAWLGEKNAADSLAQSVPHNVTSEMGLALLDVADAIRPHAEVVAFLRETEDERFLEALPDFRGGCEAQAAITAYLERYGMRCVGEIDITRPRWSEQPTTLLPLILANVENFEAGAAKRHFERGRRTALEQEQRLLRRLRTLPDGEHKAQETKQMIDRIQAFSGYREYPKYGMVSRYFIYKQALLAEAERLVASGVLGEPQDIFYLTFEELYGVVRSRQADEELIGRRKEEHSSHQALTPPRVLTSEGEAISGAYRRSDLHTGALAGTPVSAGTIEGRARVILDLAQADLQAGDILVTRFTDPSWTPAFVAIRGLVTEVGGLMTHGAVIAREYGLPAVVGVERATVLIEDGQQIRVNGTDGCVEILPLTRGGTS